MTRSKLFVTVAATSLFGVVVQPQAQEKLKIGLIATLSGPPAVLGDKHSTDGRRLDYTEKKTGKGQGKEII